MHWVSSSYLVFFRFFCFKFYVILPGTAYKYLERSILGLMEVFLTVLLCIVAMEISNQNGIIPARTSQKITATAYPSRRVSYKFKLFYELLSICGMLKFFFTDSLKIILLTWQVHPYISFFSHFILLLITNNIDT